MRRHLLDLAKPELEALLAGWGEQRFRAAQVSRWALARGVTDPEQMSDLPQALRARLTREFSLKPLSVTATVESDDGATAKVLLDLSGGDAVEAVKMDYDPDARGGRTKNRATVCVSTQVGCAMGCVFCATGQQGLTRNLTSSEILGQVLHFSRTQRITNVVFMGMGEPLANYAPTLTAIRWMIDADGMDMRARGITVSTVGLRSGIRRLAGEGLQVGLAISLHAPDDELRRRLIPTAGGTSIDDLLAAAREYIKRRGRRVTFAYALLAGVNDSVAQARALAARVRGMQAHVNLIPYNPTAGEGLRRPSRERVRAFQRELQAAGVNATVRVERGVEIAAACGQLRTETRRGRRQGGRSARAVTQG